jgi:hypothetical protein
MGGATQLYMISGYAMGKSDAEIQEGLNPLAGRKFLSHEINGYWVGLGGLVRATTQMMATIITAPERLASGIIDDKTDNPLFNTVLGRGAPGVTFSQAFLEAATGGKIDAMPFDSLNGGGQFLTKFLGPSLLPFSISSAIKQGGIHEADAIFGGDILPPLDSSALTAMPLQMIGLRSSGFTERDFKDAKANEIPADRLNASEQQTLAENGKLTWDTISGRHQMEIEKANSTTIDNYRAEGSYVNQKLSQVKKEGVNEAHRTERSLVEQLANGQIDLRTFREAYGNSEQKRVQALRAAQEALGIKYPENTESVINQYYAMREGAIGPEGAYNPEVVDAAQEAFLLTLTPEQRSLIDDRRYFEHDPSMKPFLDAKKYIAESGYWGIQTEQSDRFSALIGSVTDGGETYMDLVIALQRATSPRQRERISRVKNLIDKRTRPLRERLRRSDPDLDEALNAVYGTTPIRWKR